METEVKTRVMGVDISIDLTTYAIVDIRGNIVAKDDFPTSDYSNVNEFVSTLCDRLVMMAEENGGYEKIRSIGVSAPSGNEVTGCIENAPNLQWKGRVPLAAMLRDRLGMAVALANDAHAMALGEQTFGAAHGMRDFAVISLGHGMGSCFFSNGIVHLGNDGFAGEVGHTCFIPNGRQCGCGKRGCLEAYTAANGIVQTAQEILAERSESSMMRNVERLSPKVIQDLCELGDELAIETYRRTGYYLGVGLANYASILNPEAFVFTGGISLAGKWLFEPANEAFEEHVFHNTTGRVKFMASTLENRTRNMLGASVLAWGVKEYSLFK